MEYTNTKVDQLRVGDRLMTKDGSDARIISIEEWINDRYRIRFSDGTWTEMYKYRDVVIY